MENSLPYVLLTIFFLIIAIFQIGLKFDNKSLNILNSFVWILFIVFFGCRGFIGWDWHSYYPFYSNIKPIFQINLSKTYFDIGFVIYSSIIRLFTKDYHLYIFISTLIDGILLHLFFKKYVTKNFYAFAFAIFIVMEGTIMEVNLMRNIKALLIFLLTLQYIENRNFIRFFIFNLIGLTFHWSSIIFFPLYFFLHKKLDLRIFICIFVVGNVIYLTQIEYIKPLILIISKHLGGTTQGKTEFYFNNSLFNQQYGITLGYLERIGTTFLIMFYYNKLIDRNKSNIIFINSFIIFFIFYFYFSEVSIIIARLGNLFIFSYWILWPQIIYISSKATKYVIFATLSFYIIAKLDKTTNNILYKYDNIVYKDFQPYKKRLKVFNKESRTLQKQK